MVIVLARLLLLLFSFVGDFAFFWFLVFVDIVIVGYWL